MSEYELRVPGNILLMGEYAVLEPGGKGIALAVEPRVHAAAETASTLCARGVFGGQTAEWEARPDAEGEVIGAGRDKAGSEAEAHTGGRATDKFGAILERLSDTIPRICGIEPHRLTGKITVDSSAFFSRGRKSGFGSSAAVTVALALLLHRLATGSADVPQRRLLPVVIDAHRHAQGGRGSGYDVAASLFGGVAHFTGGTAVDVRRLQLPWLPQLSILRGAAAVDSAEAVQRYEAWKAAHPERAEAFFRRSNEAVRRFAQADGWHAGREAVLEAREAGIEIGREIGVDARMGLSSGGADGRTAHAESTADCVCKAVGAGNELGLCLGSCPGAGAPLTLSSEGPRWKQ